MSAALPAGWTLAADEKTAAPELPEGWSLAETPLYSLENLGRGIKKFITDPRGARSLPGRLDQSIQESFADDARAPLPKLPVLEQSGGTLEQMARGGYNVAAGLVNALPTAGTVAAANPIGAPIVGADMLYHAFKGAPDAGRAVVDPNVSTQEATEKVAGTIAAALPVFGLKAFERGKPAKSVPVKETANDAAAAEIEAQRAFDPQGTGSSPALPDGWKLAEEPSTESAPAVESAITSAPESRPIEAQPVTTESAPTSPEPEITTPAPQLQEPASTPEGVSGSAVTETGGQAPEIVLPRGKGATMKVGNMPDGTPDLLTAIENLGGVPGPKKGRATPEYNGFHEAFGTGPARLLRRADRGGIDTFIPQLESQGFTFGSIDDFYSAVKAASDQRLKLTKQLGDIEYGAKFDAALFDNSGRKPHLSPGEPVVIDGLSVGDTFNVRGEPVTVADINPDTGHVLLKDGVTREVPPGTPIYPDRGEITKAEVASSAGGETPFARRAPADGATFIDRAPEQAALERAQLDQLREQWRANAERVAPGLMQRFRMQFGKPERLVEMGRAQARNLTGYEEAAYLPHERMLFLFDHALQRNSELGTRINLVHELGHAFWDTLPRSRHEELIAQWRTELQHRTGPLFTKSGALKRGVARGVDSNVKEWFAERVAWANHEWAKRRIEIGAPRVGAGLVGRVAQQFRQLLLQLREYVERLRGEKVNTDFRAFLDQGDRFADVPAERPSLAQVPAFAKRRGVGVDHTAEMFGAGEVDFNLASEAQVDPARALEAKLAEREAASKQGKLFETPPDALFARRDDAKAWLQRNLTSAGGLPKEVFERKLEKDGRLAAVSKQAEFTLRDLDRAVHTVYGGYKAMTAADLAQINDVLGGKLPVGALDPRLQTAVGTMRNQIDTLSRRLVREGAISGDLAARVAGNVGFYLNRSYRKFDDPKWAQRVPVAVRNRAETFVAAELQAKAPLLPVDPAEVRGYVDYMLGKDVDGPEQLYRGPKVGSKDLSVFIKRKEIPQVIRELLGEYTDPRVNYMRSVAKTAQVLEAHAFLGDVRTAGLRGRWLHDVPRTDSTGAYVVPIAAKGSEAMAPLNGLYTTKEIAQAFENTMKPGDDAWRWWLRANGWAKVAKTAFSPMTQARNFAGNLGFLVANGHWRADSAADVWQALKGDIGYKDTPATRTYASRLTRLGIIGESVNFGELREAMKDAGTKMTGIEDFTDSRLARVIKLPFQAALRLYRTNDDVFKVYAFENERRAWAAANPRLTPEQLDTIAAERVRNTFPTYSLIPRAAQYVRRVGLTGSFLSWPAEIIRTGYHTIGYALRDLADPNPRVKAMGAKRLAGISIMATAPWAASKVSQWNAGVDAKDDENLRRFLPEWNANATLLHLGNDGRGRYRVIDGSYLDPYSYLKKPITAALRGENWLDALQGAAWESMSPFAGEGLLTKGLLDLARNRDDRGQPVYNAQAPFLDQAKEKAGHLWDVFEPGFITQARRIVKGARGEVSPSGRQYNLADEAQAVLTGARTQSMDVVQSLQFHAKRFAGERQGAELLYTMERDNRGTIDPAKVESAKAKMEQARARLYAGASQDARSAMLLGASQGEVVEALLAAGLSSTDAALIISGRYLPFFDRGPTRARVLGDALQRR